MIEDLIQQIGLVLSYCLPFECMQLAFMQKSLLALLLIAPLTAVTGVQVVNSKMAFFSDAVGHSAFAGVALGLIFSFSPDWSMPILGLFVGLMIMALKRASRLSSDTVIGVIFSGVVAFGLAIVSRNRSVARDMQMFLYGDILTIGDGEIAFLAILLVAFAVFQWYAYNRLLTIAVNPQLASVHRIPVGMYQYAFTALLSLVVIFSVRAVGVLLVTALLVVPAATARNLSRSTRGMFWISLAISLGSTVTGLLVSAQDWAHTTSGATIVLCACLLFCFSLAWVVMRPGKTADSEK